VYLYAPTVKRWLRKARLQEADIEDLCQEVFLEVDRKIVEFRREREGDTFRGWLARIAYFKYCNHRRTLRRLPLLGAGGRTEPQAYEAFGDFDSECPEDVPSVYERALNLMCRDFEDSTWQAFWRVVIENRSPSLVAEELKISANAVYIAKARVLSRLREEFGEVLE
jgi:RNA polymerase sigma-70 factor, ECF subfamily